MSDRPYDWALVAHELGGALAPVRNAVELLRRGAAGDLSERGDHLLGIASRGLGRADRVLENLVALAAPERYQGRTESLTAGAVLSGLAVELAAEAAARGVTIEVDAVPGLGCVADAFCLDQVLSNLIANAIKFTPEGGHVRLIALRAPLLPGRLALLAGGFGVTPAFTAFEVRDTGMGLSDEARRHAFRPFYRASEATGRGIPGSGLGLAVARRLAGLLHADLRLVSQVVHGACFRLVLPTDMSTLALTTRVDAMLAESASRFSQRVETLVVLRRETGFDTFEPVTLASRLRDHLDEARVAVQALSSTTWTVLAPAAVRPVLAALHAALPTDFDWRQALRLYAQRVRRGSAADERLLQGLVRCRHALPALPVSRPASEEVADASRPARG